MIAFLRTSSALLLGFGLLATTPASAQDAKLVSIDVVNGWAQTDGSRLAGLRIRVAEGWKTYWRAPGDAGVPPRFDWSGSQNLEAVKIHWPRPDVFDTYGQRTLGYEGEVVLPIELTPTDPDQPVEISGRADLGVCRDVCVAVAEPVLHTAEDGTASIQASLDLRPQLAGPEQTICTVEPISDGLRLTAKLTLPPQGGEETTVIELLQAGVWVSQPVTERHGEALTTVADLVPPQAAPFPLDPSLVRITVLGQSGAVEAMGCQQG